MVEVAAQLVYNSFDSYRTRMHSISIRLVHGTMLEAGVFEQLLIGARFHLSYVLEVAQHLSKLRIAKLGQQPA